MREVVSRFFHNHGLVLLCFSVVVAVIWWACHLRFRRLRERERLARKVEDALVQNAQGLILNVHGIVRHLAEGDPMRRRVEEALDRADEQLSEDRDRVQDLRSQAAGDEESLHPDEAAAPATRESEAMGSRAGRQVHKLWRWLKSEDRQ